MKFDSYKDGEILGQTFDDAAGEAYDKVGKLLGMGFPAGAEIDRCAKQGNVNAIPFPVSMRDQSYNFSFSGLKTAVAYKLRDEPQWSRSELRNDLLASFQFAAMQSVLEKAERAAKNFNLRAIAAAGGVAANSALRAGLKKIADELSIDSSFPAMKYCADNAAMIGFAAWKQLASGFPPVELPVRPRWPITELQKLPAHSI